MIVLHGGWDAGRFLLWGEAPADAVPTATARRGRKPKPPTDAVSPLDAGEVRLAAALKLVPWPIPPGAVTTERLTLWLPSLNHQPLASTPLIAPPPPADATPVLAPWTVTVIPLPA